MAKILSISSEVIRGHVGHAASRFVLQRLGHDVWAFPTILLSNHPGYDKFSGKRVDPVQLRDMRDALSENGWLGEVDAVFTGYLPSADHAAFAAETVELLKSECANLITLCDPAIGDDPKGVYIAEGAAEIIDSKLAGLADSLTPNRFELEWLAQMPVTTIEEARNAARALDHPRLFATSIPGPGEDELSNLLIEGGEVYCATIRKRPAVPHGTGDMMAALLLGHLLDNKSPRDALARATKAVDLVLDASEGADELQPISTQELWTNAEPWPVERIG